MRVTIHVKNATVEQVVRLIRERKSDFPDCKTWPEVQAACERHGVELGPERESEP